MSLQEALGEQFKPTFDPAPIFFQSDVLSTIYSVQNRRIAKCELLIRRFVLYPFEIQKGEGQKRACTEKDNLVTCTRSDRK